MKCSGNFVWLAFCIFNTLYSTYCDDSEAGTKLYTTLAFAEEEPATRLSRPDMTATSTYYSVNGHIINIPASYRKECESIQPCVGHVLKVSERFIELARLFDGGKKYFKVEDYLKHNFSSDDKTNPCDKHNYDNKTFIALLNICTGLSAPGPRHVTTSGEVWPQPHYQMKTQINNEVNVHKLNIKVIGYRCSTIDKAVKRSVDYMHTLTDLSKKYSTAEKPGQDQNLLTALVVNLKEPADCENLYPQFGMDESYNLRVSQGIASVFSPSVWGLLRGIETFNHLLWLPANFEFIGINNTIIEDKPHYPHRGLLVDTARHYISVSELLKTLDAMAINKMNVFHWHIVDDDSFPLQSDKFPELSDKGAYHPSMVYNKTHLETIRDFARDRGIRVIVEIDMPGHTVSWGASHPEIMTKKCNAKYFPPMNPLKEDTYKVVQKVIEEIQSIFPEHYFHLGGDEVNTECWSEYPETRRYMVEHNKGENDLLDLFFQRVFELFKNTTVPVVWEEVYSENVKLLKNTVIQTWRGHDGAGVMKSILNNGYSAIRSNHYYMDDLAVTFAQFYATEPRIRIKSLINNEALLNNLLGGEACMWGEMVDVSNLLSRVWPRTSAIAEVLWSETKGENPDDYTYRRIEEHACRMRRRGVRAEPPSGPGFCIFE